MSELDRLLAKADRLIAKGDKLSSSFAAELALVWRDAERALRVTVTASVSRTQAIALIRTVQLRDQIRAVLEQAGYDALVASATQTSVEEIVHAALTASQIAEAEGLSPRVEPAIRAMQEIGTVNLLARGDEVAIALWRSLAQSVFTGRPLADILADLAIALDDEVEFVRTLFDTQLSIYGRQIERIATDGLGDAQPFLYVGPIDDVTRPFCLDRIGQVFTRASIDAMDNGQMPDVFITGGGYNCRHSFLAVESRELKAMVGTGERVAPIAEDVARVTARKAAKKRNAA